MKNSILEITEQEYLLKLRREDFDISLIYQLLKRIQSEQFFFSRKQDDNEDDIISRYQDADSSSRFDLLSDK